MKILWLLHPVLNVNMNSSRKACVLSEQFLLVYNCSRLKWVIVLYKKRTMCSQNMFWCYLKSFSTLECQNDICNFFEYKFVSHDANKNEKIYNFLGFCFMLITKRTISIFICSYSKGRCYKTKLRSLQYLSREFLK